MEINKQILKKYEEAKEKQIDKQYGLISGDKVMRILHSIMSDLYLICDEDEDILKHIGCWEEPEDNGAEIKKELDNIKNIFRDMEDTIKKDVIEEVLELEKELSDLRFEYEEQYLKKCLEKMGKYGVHDIHPDLFKIETEYELLPLKKQIQDKQYKKNALEYKFAQEIKQVIE